MFNTLSLGEMLRNKINNPKDDLSKKYLLHEKIEIDKLNIKEIDQLSDYLFLVETNKKYLISFVFNKELRERFIKREFIKIVARRCYKKIFYDILLE